VKVQIRVLNKEKTLAQHERKRVSGGKGGVKKNSTTALMNKRDIKKNEHQKSHLRARDRRKHHETNQPNDAGEKSLKKPSKPSQKTSPSGEGEGCPSKGGCLTLQRRGIHQNARLLSKTESL